MASPVRTQGIMTLVLAAIVLAMVIGGVWAAMHLRKNGTKTPSPDRLQQQEQQRDNPSGDDSGQAPADDPDEKGLKVVAPVVYCIDTGSSMREMYDYAVALTRISIRAMNADEKFSVMLCMEGAAGDDASWQRFLPAQPRGGGPSGENAVKGELALVDRSGASDIGKSLIAAVADRPRTIVILARKEVDSAQATAALARRAGIRIITVALDAGQNAQNSLAELARAAGGESHAYSYGQLQQWLNGVNLD